MIESNIESNWECRLFGAGKSITLHPIAGEVPNWFWRKMQYLLLGNEWVRIIPEEKNSGSLEATGKK